MAVTPKALDRALVRRHRQTTVVTVKFLLPRGRVEGLLQALEHPVRLNFKELTRAGISNDASG